MSWTPDISMAITKPDVSLSWAMIKGIPVDMVLWTQFCFVEISVGDQRG